MIDNYMKVIVYFHALIITVTISWPVHSLQAREVGKIYDKTNYREIQHLLSPAMAQAVKNDGWIFKIYKFDFPLKHSDFFFKRAKPMRGNLTWTKAVI